MPLERFSLAVSFPIEAACIPSSGLHKIQVKREVLAPQALSAPVRRVHRSVAVFFPFCYTSPVHKVRVCGAGAFQ